MEVGVKPNPRRAAIVGDEARAAELAGEEEVAAYLKKRALAWLCGQKASPPEPGARI